MILKSHASSRLTFCYRGFGDGIVREKQVKCHASSKRSYSVRPAINDTFENFQF